MPPEPVPESDIEEAATEVSAYQLLGGEPVLRRIVDRFYDLMDSEPAFAGIRAMHSPDLAHARERLFWFLSGYLGGPPLYWEKVGHPRLRARHLPFPIGIDERDQWLACMARALAEEGIEDGLRERLMQAFFGTADWMRNRAG